MAPSAILDRTASPLTQPILVRWHLLSLDAPTVAALWTWFIARATHLTLPWTSIAAMFLAVWILYAADRLLDARLLNTAPLAEQDQLEARHHFHHRHRSGFLAGIVLVSILLIPLLLALPAAAMRLYLAETMLLAAWFLLIHILPSAHRLPKELAVGPFFAAAVFIPTVSRLPSARPSLILPAILLSLLCSLNCLYIYAWEHDARHARAHATTRFALQHLPWLTMIVATASLAAAMLERQHRSLPTAVLFSTTILFILDRGRKHLHRTTLRAAADLALLTPILLLLA